MNNESMVMRGGRVAFSAVLAATLVAGTAGVAPVSVASAATVSDSTYGTLDTANLPNGTYTVSFSTNRPDYIEGLSSSAGKVSITNEGSSSRQYTMTVPATESDAVYGVTMTIVPMKELGGGPVSADMRIYYSQAVDKGGDTGQIATSAKDSGVSTSGSVLPNTGDELPAGAVPAAAVLAVGAGAVAVAARRKMNEQ
ncbi:hypothetical protein AAY81_07925 [Denitrobacterium detoxificans]|uniref:LPXTG-motif cell wall anchor domain-containing protein n=1 Tax=Denitrobacterium detoxificans TaxID=79604 RepID=A0A172RZA8_9ACTN|nr:hypothetical protein [Denitrobacterium detoxificans]ANE23049.1 hypothetical protein AAY81_07925 [Denitrobacterium detoxificans]SEO51291.1 hypothetical protein SAMN02910314_00405 [Denitrobacterium detoxificans]